MRDSVTQRGCGGEAIGAGAQVGGGVLSACSGAEATSARASPNGKRQLLADTGPLVTFDGMSRASGFCSASSGMLNGTISVLSNPSLTMHMHLKCRPIPPFD